MRHRKDHRKLGRAADQRLALLRSQVDSLFRHNRIRTTVEKAKETQRLAERLITVAKRGDLAARREVLKQVQDQDLVGHLFEEIAPRYDGREGGYTRVIRAGRRVGDNAEMAIIELV